MIYEFFGTIRFKYETDRFQFGPHLVFFKQFGNYKMRAPSGPIGPYTDWIHL